MIGTSSMFFGKAIKSRLKNSDSMNRSNYGYKPDENAEADVQDFQITREFMTDAYKTNDWIRAISDTMAERVAQFELFPMPLGAKFGTKEGQLTPAIRKRMENVMNLMMKPNNDNESFNSLIKKMVRDICVYDEAGIQIIKGTTYSGSKVPYALYANITGEELYVNPNQDGTLPNDGAYVQLRAGKEISRWGKFEFINFIKNRRAGYANGLSPIETVAASILGDLEAMNYNLKFFENNARPNLAFIFENLGFGKGNDSIERARKWYSERHQGKPHLPLFMGSEKGNVKLQELRMSQKDMDFNGWVNFLLSRIMAVYGMQPFVLGVITDTTGKLNSELQAEQFKRNAVIPMVSLLTNAINPTLIWGDDNFDYDDVYLTSANLDIDDEKKQAEIDEKYLEKGVITINQVRRNLQMPSVPWGEEPFVPLNYSPLSVLLDWQKSKIESNLKSASSSGTDNNIGGDKDDNDDNGEEGTKPPTAKEAGMGDKWNALYESLYGPDATMNQYMSKNFKVPSGLENVDPTILKDTITNLIKLREQYLSKTISISSIRSFKGTHDIIDGAQLSWKNIMEKR